MANDEGMIARAESDDDDDDSDDSSLARVDLLPRREILYLSRQYRIYMLVFNILVRRWAFLPARMREELLDADPDLEECISLEQLEGEELD